jgi:hypothetical protein
MRKSRFTESQIVAILKRERLGSRRRTPSGECPWVWLAPPACSAMAQ